MRPDEFKRWRLDLRATQASIAQLFGVSRVTIQNWEHGKTRIPEAAESLWLRQALRWRQRPEHGPVVLEYYVGPKNVLNAATVGQREFPTNESALRYARDLVAQPELHFIGISDLDGEPIWFGDQVRTEVQLLERREGRRTRSPEEAAAMRRDMDEFVRRFREEHAGETFLTDDEMYDEFGLPK
jgi:transcriptional regulator with XRE-family HTH domain